MSRKKLTYHQEARRILRLIAEGHTTLATLIAAAKQQPDGLCTARAIHSWLRYYYCGREGWVAIAPPPRWDRHPPDPACETYALTARGRAFLEAAP